MIVAAVHGSDWFALGFALGLWVGGLAGVRAVIRARRSP